MFSLSSSVCSHPPPPAPLLLPRLVFQKSLTAPICIIKSPCGARLGRKTLHACLARLAWRMHYALSSPANFVCVCWCTYPSWALKLPYAPFPGICAWNTRGLSRLPDSPPRGEALVSSVAVWKQMCWKIIYCSALSKSHLQCGVFKLFAAGDVFRRHCSDKDICAHWGVEFIGTRPSCGSGGYCTYKTKTASFYFTSLKQPFRIRPRWMRFSFGLLMRLSFKDMQVHMFFK